ncbi:condensation protein, partial [Streptomyces sp. NPDC059900]
MTALDHPARHADGPEQPPERVPFPVVDEVSRHCLQEEEPETVHIEVHLPGTPDPARLKAAFAEALRRHPRILMREARGPWYRRRYEWELTAEPDVEVVTFPPAERDALKKARTRSLSQAPPLSASPPIRLEVIAAEDASGTVASGAVGAATSQNGHANAALGGAAGRGPAPGREGTVAPGSADADARSDEGASRGGAPATPGDEGAGATNSAPPVTGGTPTPNGGESTAGSGASISPGDAPTTGTTATGAAPTPNGGDATAGSG